MFSNMFCLTVPKKFEVAPYWVSKTFLYGKKLSIREGGLRNEFPGKTLCLKVPKNSVRDPSMFQKTSSKEESMDNRRCITFLCRNVFVPQCRKISRGEPLYASEKFWYGKKYG